MIVAVLVALALSEGPTVPLVGMVVGPGAGRRPLQDDPGSALSRSEITPQFSTPDSSPM
jgi:hypothetical protein